MIYLVLYFKNAFLSFRYSTSPSVPPPTPFILLDRAEFSSMQAQSRDLHMCRLPLPMQLHLDVDVKLEHGDICRMTITHIPKNKMHLLHHTRMSHLLPPGMVTRPFHAQGQMGNTYTTVSCYFNTYVCNGGYFTTPSRFHM